jgi:hypothetical protein
LYFIFFINMISFPTQSFFPSLLVVITNIWILKHLYISLHLLV